MLHALTEVVTIQVRQYIYPHELVDYYGSALQILHSAKPLSPQPKHAAVILVFTSSAPGYRVLARPHLAQTQTQVQ